MKFANNIVLPIILMIMVISGAVTFTVFFTPLYYLDVKILDIPGQSGYSLDLISRNYDTLINYMSVFNHGELAFPDLAMSPMGKIHFEEVKNIFVILQILLPITAAVGIPWSIYLYRKKHERFFFKIAGIITLALPVFLGIWAAINFDSLFITFHKIAFRNDYWIFYPSLDPVINILPEEFFMHALMLIVGIVIGMGILFLVLGRKYSKKKNKRNSKKAIK